MTATVLESLSLSHLDSIEALEANLPAAPQPVGSYVPVVQSGNLVYTSGMLPLKDGQLLCTGTVDGTTVTIEQGQAAAAQCVLNALSAINAHLGSLKKITRIVKLTGYVSSTPSFTKHPFIINAASDLLVATFGEAGRHARCAIGVAALPLDASVELDLIVEVQA